jgi:hypothetical protein
MCLHLGLIDSTPTSCAFYVVYSAANSTDIFSKSSYRTLIVGKGAGSCRFCHGLGVSRKSTYNSRE